MKNIKKTMLSCTLLCVYCVIILVVFLTSKVTYNVSIDSDAEEGSIVDAIFVGGMGTIFEELENTNVFDFQKEMKEIGKVFSELKTELYDKGFNDQGSAYHFAAISCKVAPFLLIFLLIVLGIVALLSCFMILAVKKKCKEPSFVKEAEESGNHLNLLKSCKFFAFIPLICYGCYWLPSMLTNLALAKTLGGSSGFKIGFYFKGIDLLVFAIVMLVAYFVASYVIEKVMSPKQETK